MTEKNKTADPPEEEKQEEVTNQTPDKGDDKPKEDRVEKLASVVEKLTKGMSSISYGLRKLQQEKKEVVVKEVVKEEDPDKDEVNRVKELAKKAGLLLVEDLPKIEQQKKEERAKQERQSAVNEFTAKYKVFADNDEKWDSLIQKINDDYGNSLPLTKKAMYKVLVGAMNDIEGKEENSEDIEKIKEKAQDQLRAEEKNRSRLSLGGGAGGKVGEEESLDKLKQRYPKLSKSQIKEYLDNLDKELGYKE